MENKKKFVEEPGKILAVYSREKIEGIRYIEKESGEFAEIAYTNGCVKYADITGDSCIAIMHDVYRALL